MLRTFQLTQRHDPSDSRQRGGSSRAWSSLSASLARRCVEQHCAGTLKGLLFRQLQETEGGGLQVQDSRLPERLRMACSFCASLAGAGTAAVTTGLIRSLWAQHRAEAA